MYRVKLAKCFLKWLTLNIDDHAVDLFHCFDKSSKQKSLLKEHYEFCDTDYSEIIKFISTHWLCLGMCVNREPKKYEGLKPHFLSASGAGDRFRRLKNAFREPVLEIYLLFYQGLLPVFLTFNKYFQREVPLIYQLPEAQERFMNEWAARFINPEVIQEIKNEEKSFAKSKRRHRSWNWHSHQVKSKTTSWKRRYFSRSFWQILWWSQNVFFISLPILCKVVTTGGFPSSKLQICWFWSEKHFFVWLRSTYNWIFDTINWQLIEHPELLDTFEEEFME